MTKCCYDCDPVPQPNCPCSCHQPKAGEGYAEIKAVSINGKLFPVKTASF